MNINDTMREMLSTHEFMNLRAPLQAMGATKVDFSFEPVPCYTFTYQGTAYAICNAKYADKADVTVNSIAFGKMGEL